MTTVTQSLPVTPAEARALLAAAGSGEAVVIRRVMEEQPDPCTDRWYPDASRDGWWMPDGPRPDGKGMRGGYWRPCPCGKPGDVLDVLEPWYRDRREPECAVIYAATPELSCLAGGKFNRARCVDGYFPTREECVLDMERSRFWEIQPAATMPPWAVRLTLTVTSTSLARSDAGAWAWGISCLAARKGLER